MIDKLKKFFSAISATIAALSTIINFIELYNNDPNLVLWVSIFVFFILLVFGTLYLYRLLTTKKATYPKLSVVRIMQKRKTVKNINYMSLIMLCVLGYSLLFKYYNFHINNEVFYIGFATVAILGIYNFLIDFRIGKGYYGNNEREAREIIQFILQEADNIDFTDNGKLKKIVSEADLEELSNLIGSHLIPEHG